MAQDTQYDIAYIWDSSLENVLDYQEQLGEVFEQKEMQHFRIVGRGQGEYGIIYDANDSALNALQTAIKHSQVLRQAGLAECEAVKDHGYYELYNVSYGLGPNLDALKKVYTRIYSYLGEEVGKNLFIMQTSGDNYSLVYRRMGDRASTYTVARRHAKLLKSKRIRTSITPEVNSPVIYGESSHLYDAAESPAVTETADAEEEQEVLPDAQEEQTVVALTPRLVKKRFSLPTSGNFRFEKGVEELIGELRRKGSISGDERTSWVVYDLGKGESLVNINADDVFQAASMIKPFISLAFFHQVREGSLVYGPKSRRNMEAMIQHSNNGSTNWVIKMAGGPARCEEILRKHYSHIFRNTRIVEYIPAGGKTYKNSAVPSDYVRFLQALWNDELPYSKEMRRLMSLPGRDRLYDGTPIPRGTMVYNKTGSTAHLCGDMGILVLRGRNGQRYPYAIVGIIEKSNRARDYGTWMRTRGNVIRQVSTLVYQEMKSQYRL
ncbi:MAG: serine hydrolase [Desulfopila sp.]|nr:serine hydrolase [Desulfopila sp.]